MKIMLSWSGPRSKAMASALRDWIPNIIQSADPWMSDSDIDIGERWGSILDNALEKTHFGILCLTSECLESPWIHYEAGALSKFVDKAHVCPCLLGLKPGDVKGPFVNFQAAEADETGTFKLAQSINRASDTPLPEERINTIFKRFWSDLETSLNAISTSTQKISKPRPDTDILSEILELSRGQSKAINEIQVRLDEPNTKFRNISLDTQFKDFIKHNNERMEYNNERMKYEDLQKTELQKNIDELKKTQEDLMGKYIESQKTIESLRKK